ncbi:transcriptional regulator NarL [Oceanobacillus picturae]|uniref:Transcriptional regulator NarL n=1 Tax=Oceanobacillus picturae TaxID=171693 RepID=W9AD85_9BACI|nr:LuxR C-terminal-related transcriptional regulator [Oceanobacillus picturae]CDO03684.1 transcriptional regulator NarL [Oceanobacillus picturae]
MIHVGLTTKTSNLVDIAIRLEKQSDITVHTDPVEVLRTSCSVIFIDLRSFPVGETIVILKELANHNVKTIGLASGKETPDFLLNLLEEGMTSILVDYSTTCLKRAIYATQKDHSILSSELLQLLKKKVVEKSQAEEEAFAHNLLQAGINLTPKEIGVAYYVEKGLKNRDIAFLLGMKETTVKVHISHIYTKLAIKRRKNLVQHLKELKYKEKGACS